ncbi:MAG TPA: hypothetical protein EYQ66_10325 [Myxococcales bacterium]|nr:hypothetical protein [Myxococcales bacterium]
MRRNSSAAHRVARGPGRARTSGTRGRLALASVLCVPGVTGASLAAEPVGFVADVYGEVVRRAATETTWQAAVVDEAVWVGDTLRTGLNSAAKIVLVDDTTLGLGEDTLLTIDQMWVGPEALTEPSILRQLSGQLRTRVGEAFGGTTRIEIHTPTAIMGVKGTEGTTRVDGAEKRGGIWSLDGDSPEDEEEISTVVRNWEGGITAAMLDGVHLPVPPGQCRVVYRDRIGEPADCPGDFVPVAFFSSVPLELASLQVDLLVGTGLPAVSAGPDGGGIGDVVGEALVLEPPDPVIEDRTDADEFAGIGIDPLADIVFDPGEVGSNPGDDPLGDIVFDPGEVGSNPGDDPLGDIVFDPGEVGSDAP